MIKWPSVNVPYTEIMVGNVKLMKHLYTPWLGVFTVGLTRVLTISYLFFCRFLTNIVLHLWERWIQLLTVVTLWNKQDSLTCFIKLRRCICRLCIYLPTLYIFQYYIVIWAILWYCHHNLSCYDRAIKKCWQIVQKSTVRSSRCLLYTKIRKILLV